MSPLAILVADCLSGPRWHEIVGALSSLLLVVVATFGVFVARTIPKRISDDEIAAQKRRHEQTSKAVSVVLHDELAALKRRLKAINRVLKNAVDCAREEKEQVVDNPLRKFMSFGAKKPALIGSPQQWLQNVDAELAGKLVQVNSAVDDWAQAIALYGQRDSLHIREVEQASSFIDRSVRAIDESFDCMEDQQSSADS